jgi:hypothetical protein
MNEQTNRIVNQIYQNSEINFRNMIHDIAMMNNGII